jgi:DNA-binding GntR family transcriptional regulator
MLDSAARVRVTREHRELIDALKDNDVARLKSIAEEHRDGAIENLGLVLGNSPGLGLVIRPR